MLREGLEARIARLLDRARAANHTFSPPAAGAATLAASVQAMIDSSIEKLVDPLLRKAVRERPSLAEGWPLCLFASDATADEADLLRRLSTLEQESANALRRDEKAWLADAFALVVATEREVAADRKRASMAIDAGHPHHSLVESMRDQPKDGLRKRGAKGQLVVESGYIEVIAPEQGSVQLHFPVEGLNETILHSLRDWRGPKGLRHWAALQRLLSVEGGRTGRVQWKLEEHLEALGYSQRSREDLSVRQGVAQEVELLTKMELAVYDRDGRLRLRQALLTPITKAERQVEGTDTWALEGLVLEVHPLLYDGVRDPKTGALGTNWYPQTVELARIDDVRFPYAIALGLVLPVRWRWAWAQGADHCALSGANLLRAAGIRYDRARASRAWGALRRSLDALIAINALGRYEWARGDETLSGICRLYPPAWAQDRTLHALPPLETVAPRMPSTGHELRAWRTGKGWTQAKVADLLGVGARTVKRAESAPDEPLGPAITKSLSELAERSTPDGALAHEGAKIPQTVV